MYIDILIRVYVYRDKNLLNIYRFFFVLIQEKFCLILHQIFVDYRFVLTKEIERVKNN